MTLLYAHRGAGAELPENTVPAFLRAIEVGAMAIETDAHVTKDGHVVLSHDPTGERAAGVRKAIAASTLAEVRSWNVSAGKPDVFTMPTLEEALSAVPAVPFNVDCKPTGESAVRRIVAEVRRLHAQDRVTLASFSTATMRLVRRLGYEGKTGHAQAEVAFLALTPLRVLRVLPPPGDAVQVPVAAFGVRLDRQAFMDKCHALGKAVHYWTINEPDEARRLMGMGADGIMTDDPRKLATLVPELAARTPST